MSEALIGQTIVTDPAVGGSSGYLLVAASESVRPEDRQHLEAVPQVSDYLHLTKDERETFFSFHRLPSGAWAFSKRFFHGKRRGEFNRIVNHSLIISEREMDELWWEPWLLVTACQFQERGGTVEESYDQLTARAGEPGQRSVRDVVAIAQYDLADCRYTMIEGRCDFLRTAWGGEVGLISNLAEVFAAVENRCPLLLTQDQWTEQLLYLAWSTLPLSDRQRIAWTAHIAPGGGAFFRLALSPDPYAARAEQEKPEEWVVFVRDEILDGAGSESLAREGSEPLARCVVMDSPPFRKSDLNLATQGLGLSTSGLKVAKLLIHLEKSDDGPAEGFNSAEDLARFFDSRKITGRVELETWERSDRWLELAADTLVNLYRAGTPWDKACDVIYQVLADKKRALADLLVKPEALREIERRGQGARRLITTLALSLKLSLGFPPTVSRTWKEDLLAALPPPPRGGFGKASDLPAARVLADLAFGLARSASHQTQEAFRLLQEEPEGFAAVMARLEASTPNLPLTRQLLHAALEAGNLKGAGQIAKNHLVPLLEMNPESALSLGEDLDRFLDALRAAPLGLVSALQDWPSKIYGHAVETLKRWIDTAKTAALQVAEEAASPRHAQAIREDLAILGLAEQLADGGAPASSWLPFARAEAIVLHESQEPAANFQFISFLERARIQDREEGISRVAEEILRDMGRKEVHLGPAFRAMVERVAPGFKHHVLMTVATFARLSNLSEPFFREWGETVAVVAAALTKGGYPQDASMLCRNWWESLAHFPLQRVSPAALQMLNELRGHDRRAVANLWISKIPAYGNKVGGDELERAMRRLTAGDPHADPGLLVNFDLEAVGRQLREGRMDIEFAVAQVEEILLRAKASHQLLKALQDLLPKEGPERAHAVVRLLLSKEILPSTQRLIELNLRDEALRAAKKKLHAVLWPLPLSELARRPNLLLAVARRYGEMYTSTPDESNDFLRWAAEDGRFDAVSAFLDRAETTWSLGESYLDQLDDPRQSKLLSTLWDALRDPVYAWDLAPFARRIAEKAVHLRNMGT